MQEKEKKLCTHRGLEENRIWQWFARYWEGFQPNYHPLQLKEFNGMWSNETNPLKRSCSKLKVSFFPPFFLFLAILCSMWDSSTLARDWTDTLCIERQSLNLGSPVKSHYSFLLLLGNISHFDPPIQYSFFSSIPSYYLFHFSYLFCIISFLVAFKISYSCFIGISPHPLKHS